MIDYDKLKALHKFDKLKYIQNLINKKILEQNDYGKNLDGVFYGVGERISTEDYMKLKFFNIGYGNALEMMMGLLNETETVSVRGVERDVREFDSGHEACAYRANRDEK